MILSLENISNRLLVRLKDNYLQLLLLLLLTALTYWELTTHSLLINWDDQAYITHNPAIRGFSFENLKTAFTGYYVGNYAPLHILSYMIDYALWGLNPFGYVIANITYHYISGVILFFLLIRFGFWKWGAFLGAAIFLVHPVQVESVAWISQRKNLLAMLFYLLSFHAYLSYCENDGNSHRKWYYVWSVISFSLALLAKSVAVIFPVMLIMYDWLIPPVRRDFKAYRDKIPYFVAAVIFAVVAMISQGGTNGGGRIEYPPNSLVVLPLSMLPVLVRYLNLLICPLPSLQSIMYFPTLRSEIDFVVMMSFCVLFGLVAVGAYLYRKNQKCMFWYALFFLGLIPVSQIIPLVTMMNDRYLYFPMLGVAGLVAQLSGYLRGQVGMKVWGKTLLVLSAGILITLSVASHIRGKVWRNSISLFSDAVAKSPNQTNTWSRLAEGYVASGDLAMAQHYYENAARFGELDADARNNLARIYLMEGEYDKAHKEILWLLRNVIQGKINLLLLGEYYYRIGSYPEAVQYISSYLEAYPQDSLGLYLLGRISVMTGDFAQAREYYFLAAATESASADLFYGIACLESMEGNREKSEQALKKAFERGIKFKNMQQDERCLTGMKEDPRFKEIIRQYIGE